MARKKRMYIIGFLVLGIILLLFFIKETRDLNKLGKPIEERFIIKSNFDNVVIHISRRTFGLTGGNRLTLLSSTPKRTMIEYDPETDYKFSGFSPIFIKITRDSLFIETVQKSPEPSRFGIGLKVVQRELTRTEFLQLEESFQSRGYQKIE